MRTRPSVSLVALLVMAFVFYTNDYIIAGILPELASGVGVSAAAAGQLVTAFSLTIAIVAPPAAVALSAVSTRTVFAIALLVFIGANLTAAMTSSFGVLIILRIAAAAAAATATPALHAYAASIAPSGKRGKYTAIVTLGVTGSLAAGVPIGTWIGDALGWRAVFASMAIAGAVTLVLILAFLPSGQRRSASGSVAEQLRSLTKVPILLGLLMSCALMCGAMMLLTYFALYLDAVTASGPAERGVALSVAGLAGMLGVLGGGLAVDRLGPERSLAIGITTFCCTMLALWLLRFIAPVPFPVVLALGMIWGATAFWNAPAIQIRLQGLAGPLAHQALAMNTSSNFLGVSLGAAVGGIVISVADATTIPLIAATSGIFALLLLLVAPRSPVAA